MVLRKRGQTDVIYSTLRHHSALVTALALCHTPVRGNLSRTKSPSFLLTCKEKNTESNLENPQSITDLYKQNNMVNVTTTYFPSYMYKSPWSVFLNMRRNLPFQGPKQGSH